jgi:hypothetical protein
MNNIDSILAGIEEKLDISEVRPLYQGLYYDKSQIRSSVFECKYQNKTVILKIVDDVRIMEEISAHQHFLEKNTSKKIKAPQIYEAEQVSPTVAWCLMEKIPEGEIFDRAMIKENRQEFLDAYLEYRQNFPTKPPRPLTILEHLPANDFHTMRLSRWADLGNTNEYIELSKGGKRLIEPILIAKLFSKSLKLINKSFANRPMIWSKGNFWPKHLIKTGENEYYILDFSLTKMYPEGYELGGIVWSQYLMEEHYEKGFDEWFAGVEEWMGEVEKIAETLKYESPDELIRACVLERTWGTIFADVLASDKPELIKREMLGHLVKLVEKLIGDAAK